jgi:hypothetical protein
MCGDQAVQRSCRIDRIGRTSTQPTLAAGIAAAIRMTHNLNLAAFGGTTRIGRFQYVFARSDYAPIHYHMVSPSGAKSATAFLRAITQVRRVGRRRSVQDHTQRVYRRA